MRPIRAPLAVMLPLVTSCVAPMRPSTQPDFAPTEVVDLGTLVTADLPERFWGKAALRAFGFTRPNSFELVRWSFDSPVGTLAGSDSYYTLFNHGGPHVDAPVHMSVGGGIDSFSVSAFAGPVKVFDARGYPPGRSVPPNAFRGLVSPGDVVLIFTGYQGPTDDSAMPVVVTLTQEAAEFLATLPVRAFGTDALGVESPQATDPGEGSTPGAQLAPIHNAFLTRRIPVYESLSNVDRLIGKGRMFFVGAPLNIKDGDGMLVRPLVFVY